MHLKRFAVGINKQIQHGVKQKLFENSLHPTTFRNFSASKNFTKDVTSIPSLAPTKETSAWNSLTSEKLLEHALSKHGFPRVPWNDEHISSCNSDRIRSTLAETLQGRVPNHTNIASRMTEIFCNWRRQQQIPDDASLMDVCTWYGYEYHSVPFINWADFRTNVDYEYKDLERKLQRLSGKQYQQFGLSDPALSASKRLVLQYCIQQQISADEVHLLMAIVRTHDGKGLPIFDSGALVASVSDTLLFGYFTNCLMQFIESVFREKTAMLQIANSMVQQNTQQALAPLNLHTAPCYITYSPQAISPNVSASDPNQWHQNISLDAAPTFPANKYDRLLQHIQKKKVVYPVVLNSAVSGSGKTHMQYHLARQGKHVLFLAYPMLEQLSNDILLLFERKDKDIAPRETAETRINLFLNVCKLQYLTCLRDARTRGCQEEAAISQVVGFFNNRGGMLINDIFAKYGEFLYNNKFSTWLDTLIPDLEKKSNTRMEEVILFIDEAHLIAELLKGRLAKSNNSTSELDLVERIASAAVCKLISKHDNEQVQILTPVIQEVIYQLKQREMVTDLSELQPNYSQKNIEDLFANLGSSIKTVLRKQEVSERYTNSVLQFELTEIMEMTFSSLLANEASLLTLLVSVGRKSQPVVTATTRYSSFTTIETEVSNFADPLTQRHNYFPPLWASDIEPYLAHFIKTSTIPPDLFAILARFLQGVPRTSQQFIQYMLRRAVKIGATSSSELVKDSIMEMVREYELPDEEGSQDVRGYIRKSLVWLTNNEGLNSLQISKVRVAFELALLGSAEYTSLSPAARALAETGISHLVIPIDNKSYKAGMIYNISMIHQLMFQVNIKYLAGLRAIAKTNNDKLLNHIAESLAAYILSDIDSMNTLLFDVDEFQPFLRNVCKPISKKRLFHDPAEKIPDVGDRPEFKLAVQMIQEIGRSTPLFPEFFEKLVVAPSDKAGPHAIALLLNRHAAINNGGHYTVVTVSMSRQVDDSRQALDTAIQDIQRVTLETLFRRRDGTAYQINDLPSEDYQFATDCSKIINPSVRQFRANNGKVIGLMFAPNRSASLWRKAVNAVTAPTVAVRAGKFINDWAYTNQQGDLIIHIGKGNPHWEKLVAENMSILSIVSLVKEKQKKLAAKQNLMTVLTVFGEMVKNLFKPSDR